MDQIEVSNDYSYLVTNNSELKEKLWKLLRFRNRNYYHTRLYKQGIWDGYTNFFDKKTGKFLSGLLPEIEFILKHFKVDYTLKDGRPNISLLYKNIDNQFLNKWLPKGEKPITLTDYQVDFINQAIKYKRGIIKAPTSAGKTYVLLGIMKALPKMPILFLGNRLAITGQNYDEMQKWGLEDVGRLDSRKKEPNLITCATVQSLHYIEKLLPKFQALLVDEVHMMMSPSCIRAYKKLKGCSVRIGLSATPFKFGEKDKVQKYSTKGFFGGVFMTKASDSGALTTELLQRRGRISNSRCVFYYIDEPQIQYDLYMDAVTNGIAQSWHFHQIVKRLAESLKGRILILVERLAHGDVLNSLIPNSLWVQGKDDDDTRKYVINELKKSKDKVVAIATRQIFDTGINVYLHSLINAAGGSASHQTVQMLGRGLRLAEDKSILHYYDFIFRINQYLERHSYERIKTLKEERHNVIIKNEIDF